MARTIAAMFNDPRPIGSFETSSRVFGLDLLRAYAIFCVVHGHGYALLYPFIQSSLYKLPVIDGVSVFFVLSGFLIGRILLRTLDDNRLDLSGTMQFWLRRWFRTLPAYALVLCSLVLVWTLGQRPLPDDLPKYFAFLQNFASPHPDFFAEAWSLAVEEWFYVLTPLALLLAGRLGISRKTSTPALIVGVIVSVTLFRIYRAHGMEHIDLHAWDVGLKKQVITRFDSLMYGVLGAYLSLNLPDQWRKLRIPAFALGLSLLALEKAMTWSGQASFYLTYFSLTVLPVGTLLTLPLLSSWRLQGPGGGFAKLITSVSLTSYSMYLIHFTIVLHLVVPKLKSAIPVAESTPLTTALLCTCAYWLLSSCGAYLLWRYFEVPMTSLRDRFKFAPSGQPAALVER